MNRADINTNFSGCTLPHSVDIEDAVLAALMLERDAYMKVDGLLKSECFYREENQIIFKCIQELNAENKSIDLFTVTERLDKKSNLEKVGGHSYIAGLTIKIASATHIEYHARIVLEKYIQRELIRLTYEAQKRASNDDFEDVEELMSSLIAGVERISEFSFNNGVDSETVLFDTIKEVEQDCEKNLKGETSGINTGFAYLNNYTGGWKAPNFIVFGARPSVGKTTQAIQFAITAAQSGYWVNFYTYEMIRTDLFKIILAGESGLNRTAIRDGKLSVQQFDRLIHSSSQLKDLKILWYDDPNIKASQIKSNTHKNKRHNKCDLVIIDYLQLIPPDNPKENRERQISIISRTLKTITTSIKVPVITLSQLNREIEKRGNPEPQLSDLRESGSLEQDADIVIFSWIFKEPDSELVERWNKVAKNRRGKTGQFQIWDDGQMTRLYDEDPNKFNSLKDRNEKDT